MIVVMSVSLSYIGHIALFGHFKLLLPFYIGWPRVQQTRKFFCDSIRLDSNSIYFKLNLKLNPKKIDSTRLK